MAVIILLIVIASLFVSATEAMWFIRVCRQKPDSDLEALRVLSVFFGLLFPIFLPAIVMIVLVEKMSKTARSEELTQKIRELERDLFE